jgi:hypothetical protein
MLTAATLGMAAYAIFSIGSGLLGLLGALPVQLEPFANLGLIVLGILLLLASAFVRVQFPGGVALALGALLGLQALALHNDAHSYGGVTLVPQVGRGAFAAALALLAYFGSRAAPSSDEAPRDRARTSHDG